MQNEARPDHTKMFGLTHALDGQPIVREPKLVKVSIGQAKGRALEVFIGRDNQWNIKHGYKKGEIKRLGFDTREEAEEVYWKAYEKAPVCPYPRKLGYFTFNRTGPDGLYVPDFDAIEAHGPEPGEIDIVFFDPEPFSGQYAMWSASELKCKGDGCNAERVITMAEGPEQSALAKQAKDEGKKFFPVNVCWTNGCQYQLETKKGNKTYPSLCKPSGDLTFQLCHKITLGGSAFFHTGGYRSISQIFSSLYRIKMVTGNRLAGIPLKLILKQFKTNNDGKAGTAYGVSLELRASDVEDLQKKMLSQGREFWAIANQDVTHQIDAPADNAPIEEGDSQMPAEAMAAEFYPTEGDDEESATESDKVEEKTVSATEVLAEKLKKEKAKQKAASKLKTELKDSLEKKAKEKSEELAEQLDAALVKTAEQEKEAVAAQTEPPPAKQEEEPPPPADEEAPPTQGKLGTDTEQYF